MTSPHPPVHVPRRRTRATLAALTALVAGLLATVAAAPARAGVADLAWVATGPTAVATSDGSASAPQMTYDLSSAGGEQSWSFTATHPATAPGPATYHVPWTWQGLHAWFMVTARLEAVTGGETPVVLESHGPVSCCTAPSDGFVYSGITTFTVDPGETFGFRLSGSNADFNNILRGTFTLSTRPFLDATIGQDNRQWYGADDLSAAGTGTGVIEEADEARWFRFPVVPGQQVNVSLTGIDQDYDLALYSDIGDAFDRLSALDSTADLVASTAAATPAGETQVPQYPAEVTTIPTSTTSAKFAPRVYAPRVYAPRVYAPRVYAPRVYAPLAYGGKTVVENIVDSSFSRAYTVAQDQTLLVTSANTGTRDETVTAGTGNTLGHYYVRVQGYDRGDFDAARPFTLTLTTSDPAGTQCEGLSDLSGTRLGLEPTDGGAEPESIILTDTNRLGLSPGADRDAFLATLDSLAEATGGTRLDLADSPRVAALWDQVANHPSCPYAANLVAEAIRQVIALHRTPTTAHVVIAGGDDVIPFFRYPDVSGLGQESQFEPPVLPDTPSGASLRADQVLSQDAYGSDRTITVGGTTLPVPDLAVGRLVKSPAQIASTVDHYLGLAGGTLPTPTSSLVTGYDFLADAADAVQEEFVAALPPTGASSATLIDHPGVEEPDTDRWNADQLRAALLGTAEAPRHHDLVYLAGHFSANDAEAADFETALAADELAVDGPYPKALEDSIVLSAGCHSGYGIVDSAAVPGRTNPVDWTERMAAQHAILIGGTGYQYGDSDFLEYSERLYLDVARRLHQGATDDAAPVAVGAALVRAKQDYLAGLGVVSGIDAKALLQATLYGLPMTGFDAPRRTPITTDEPTVTPVGVGGGPGSVLGLSTADLDLDTPSTERETASGVDPEDPEQAGLPALSRWLEGRDGVAIAPGAPALPKQVENVTATTVQGQPGKVLRGIGFREGDYADTSGVLPVTGAPAIEGSTPHTTFETPAFFPQTLVHPNYFGTLGGGDRTSLVLTPAQYRSDPEALTNTQRAYSRLGLRLFYSDDSDGTRGPAVAAAAPSISGPVGLVKDGVVRFSATVAGDPTAGVQEVWVTWTGSGTDSGAGHWSSVDLEQDPYESTLWHGSLTLPPGQSWEGLRFLVQAANGAGAVGLDTGDGNGHRVALAPDDAAVVDLVPDASSPFGVGALVTDDQAPVVGRTVRFTVSRAGAELFGTGGVTEPDGRLALSLPPGEGLPSGRLVVTAELFSVDGLTVIGSETRTILVQGATLVADPAWLTGRAGTDVGQPLGVTLTDARGPVAGVPVTFTLPAGTAQQPGARFADGGTEATVLTDGDGAAVSPPITAGATEGSYWARVTADGASLLRVAMANRFGSTDFLAPVSATTLTTRNGTTPVKLAVLLADGRRLDDAAASSLVGTGQVQVRWRPVSSTGPWQARTDLARYDAKRDFFQADLKASRLGLVAGTGYTVQLRVLPAEGEPWPPGETRTDSDFDLGRRGFVLRVT